MDDDNILNGLDEDYNSLIEHINGMTEPTSSEILYSRLLDIEARLVLKRCNGNQMRHIIVRKVISGSGNRSNPRPDWGRLPCMAVSPLSRSATIKGGQARAR
jgi:hypothetical protein